MYVYPPSSYAPSAITKWRILGYRCWCSGPRMLCTMSEPTAMLLSSSSICSYRNKTCTFYTRYTHTRQTYECDLHFGHFKSCFVSAAFVTDKQANQFMVIEESEFVMNFHYKKFTRRVSNRLVQFTCRWALIKEISTYSNTKL